ncbi:MAG: porin family protein [Bacteroidales bacterium]|nr:porin family protein [Bacteroidales bacterium]
MKLLYKVLVLAVSAFALSQTASAQVYIGGSLSIASVHQDKMDWEETASSNMFSFAPEVGYLYKDNWAFGGRLSFAYASAESFSGYSVESSEKTSAFALVPYTAYRALSFGDFSVWAEGALSIIPAQDNVDGSLGISIAPVLSYELGEHFILRTGLNFAGLSLSRNFDKDVTTFGLVAGGEDILKVGDITIGAVYRF